MTAPPIQLPELIKANQDRWDRAKFSPRRLQIAAQVAIRLCAPKAKAIYRELEGVTGVPWYIIAVIHEREASQKWDRNIAQGDRWDRRSVNVPKGRGPFTDFKSAAIDALVNCAPYASKWKDWSPGGALTLLELYNGTGYERYHHMASPYLWAGTDQYQHGKYVGDHQWSDSEVDQQLGCAVLLKQMAATDPECTFGAPPSPANTFVAEPDKGEPPELDPASYPDPVTAGPPPVDPDTPPTPTYAAGPPPARAQAPAPDDAEAEDPVKATGIKLVKDAITSKIGTKTVAVTTTAASTAVASADDSWFAAIGHAMQTPRFWIIAVIVIAGILFVVYQWVKEHKAAS